MLVLYAVFEVKFLVPIRFLMKVFCSNIFLNRSFHVGVGQKIPKLILYQILYI